jgi:hypothetical protein
MSALPPKADMVHRDRDSSAYLAKLGATLRASRVAPTLRWTAASGFQWRIIARIHWLFEEFLRIVVPKLTHVRIAPDGRVDERAVPFLNPANINREGQIAVVIKLHRSRDEALVCVSI